MKDYKLKQALVKMLPDLVYFDTFGCMRWIYDFNDGREDRDVLDTELLYLCALAVHAQINSPAERDAYLYQLCAGSLSEHQSLHKCESATWQQRATALAKVKGIEV